MADLRHFTTVQLGQRNNAMIEFSDQRAGFIQVRVAVNMELSVVSDSLWGGFMDEVSRLLSYSDKSKVNA